MSKIDANIEITEERVRELLTAPDSFAYMGRNDEMFKTWSIGPTILTRDSSLLDTANYRALKKHLEGDPSLDPDFLVMRASHWMCGWADHLTFKVLEPLKKGEKGELPGYPGMKVTRIARIIQDWYDGLAEYPCADDSELSKLEHEAMCEHIRNEAKTKKIGDLPKDYDEKIYDWLWHNRQKDMNTGEGYVDKDALAAAVKELGFNDKDDE